MASLAAKKAHMHRQFFAVLPACLPTSTNAVMIKTSARKLGLALCVVMEANGALEPRAT